MKQQARARARTTQFRRQAASLVAALSWLTTTACGAGDNAAAASDVVETAIAAPAADERPGSLSFELRTPDGAQFDSFDYVITGPHFTKAASVDVSNSNTVSVQVDQIPAAPGYAITFTGMSAAPDKLKCAGSTGFDVSPGVVTHAAVTIDCHADKVANPNQPTPAPLPPFVPWLLGFALLGLGVHRRAFQTSSFDSPV